MNTADFPTLSAMRISANILQPPCVSNSYRIKLKIAIE